ncbi:MAG: DUF2202 domain-containing protein [Magnetococcus sp. MYC-9]
MSVTAAKPPGNGLKNGAGEWLSGKAPRPRPTRTRTAQSVAPWLLTAGLVGVVLVSILILSFKNGKPPSIRQLTTDTLSGSGVIPIAAQVAVTPLSAVDRANLLIMREEEKLARDLYLEMHRLWGASLFKSVASEEQEHMDAMARLLVRYQLPDPVGNNPAGRFVNTTLTTLYQSLLQRGRQSVDEALKVCALQEEINILDLDVAIQASTPADIRTTYMELRRDSFNHLRAFAHGLELRGTAYQGTRLPQQTVQTILHGPMDRGFMLR